METELTFVAPEGVYSLTEEHKPSILSQHIASSTPAIYPSRLSTCVVRFPATRHAHASSPGLTHFLGGGKDNKSREKDKEREDGKSLSSSGGDRTDDDNHSDHPLVSPHSQTSPPASPPYDPSRLFAPPLGHGINKKKSISRPKQNMKTTTSTFVTRMQTMEGLAKYLQSKQGDVTFLFYNASKNFFWTDIGAKSKVLSLYSLLLGRSLRASVGAS